MMYLICAMILSKETTGGQPPFFAENLFFDSRFAYFLSSNVAIPVALC